VVRINDMLDRERLSLCRALGFAEIPATERLFRMGYADVVYPTLLEAYQTSSAFSQIKAPKSLEDRYLLEDVPYGLVFFASLGDTLGVPMETTKRVVEMANLISGRDFWVEGLTLDKLGLDGLSREGLMEFLRTGVSDKVRWASTGGER
jgi:opine dehydrogenase